MPRYFRAGDAIAGQRIAANFRRFISKGILDAGVLGAICYRAKLKGSAYCVIDRCLRGSVADGVQKSNIHLARGDSLKGEQIISEFGKKRATTVTAGTSAHRIQRTVFEDDAFCIIDLPFESVRKR
jgi:hypothetical protein